MKGWPLERQPGGGFSPVPVESNSWSAEGDDVPLELGAIYHAHAARVAGWVARLGEPTLDAEDLVHEVFLVVRDRLSTFRGEAKLTTWLYRITANVVMDRRRRERRRRLRNRLFGREASSTTGMPNPVDELERRETTELVYRVLGAMKENYRTLLILFEIEGLSGEQIAELTGIKLKTVWVRLHRARAQFRQKLARERATGIGR